MSAPVYTKAPAAPVMTFNWTGCHVGGHLGGVVSQDKTGDGIAFGSGGFVGGGQVGCDYQFASGWVAGAEGRIAWSSLQNTHAASVINLITLATRPSQFTVANNYLASATARLGHTFADRWLVFVRGGGAWTSERVDDAFTDFAGFAVDPRATVDRSGWTAGTGVEWGFAAHWSASLEYNYYDFGGDGMTLLNAAPPTTVTIFSLKDRIHAVTAGVNYHF